jgi:cytochrome d ubiquinol oxidase subunit II
MASPGGLETLWFVLLTVLWVGFFVLEGFDFGVGMVIGLRSRPVDQQRALIHTIGPVWDGNEVWLIVAGGATFAAFPGWYAALFSSFYLPMLLILLCLILRGVAFEFWGKGESDRWRRSWELVLGGASLLVSFLFGVAFADIVGGVPLNAHHNLRGGFLQLLHPYALFGGLAAIALFLAHGLAFLSLRTRGPLLASLRATAQRLVGPLYLPAVGFLVWTALDQRHGGVKVSATVLAGLAAVLLLAVRPLFLNGRAGRAFVASSLGIGLAYTALFVWLFPAALPSSAPRAHTLLLHAAAANHYALEVMTVAAAVLLPVVLAYQGWTYWVFRQRLGPQDQRSLQDNRSAPAGS